MAHNTFTRLVNGDNDLVGLVAYSLYKQEKNAWVDQRRLQFGQQPTPAEIERDFIQCLRDSHIQQWRKDAENILNQFADNMLAAELEKERDTLQAGMEAFKNDEIFKALNPHWFKKLCSDTGANILSGIAVTLLIALLWVVSSAPENFIAGILSKAMHGQIPNAEATQLDAKRTQ